MFYSHDLLARKAPLGQIWMAATMHAKMSRRKLDIVQICEEILNPSVPMALRISGILMNGVVIVYERKVKLLHDDVNRLLVEINAALKVKTVSDPTLLPKGKSQARKEAITLPDLEETAYINMVMEEDPFQQLHQVDADDITLFDPFDSYQAADLYDRFKRFDTEGDEETQIPTTYISSPPRDEPQRG